MQEAVPSPFVEAAKGHKSTVTVHAVAASLTSRSHSLPAHAAPREGAGVPPVQHRRPVVQQSTSAAQYTQRIELYRGSVSTVYRAVDEASGARVILKCYHKDKMQEKHYHKLDREIMAMQALRGPFVAELYGWFQDEDAVWLVMEWCEGGDLFKCMMVHGGRLDEFYVCTEIIAPLLRVLEKSHTQNLMHRDIKPENIFLTKGNRLRLGDFGLAVNWTQELPFSRSGTLDYMAPEVLRNPASTMQESPKVQMAALNIRTIKPYNEKVDVWAVGVLAYELVVGKPPFEVEDEAKTASLIMYSNSIRFPSAHSPLWADFVRTVLVKDPAQRPSAAQAMNHAWIQHHLQSALLKAAAQGRVSSKKALLLPLPLPTQPVTVVNTLSSSPSPAMPAPTRIPAPAPAPAVQTPPSIPAPRPQSSLPPTSPGLLLRTPQPMYHGAAAHAHTQPARPAVLPTPSSTDAFAAEAPYSPTINHPSRPAVPSQASSSGGGSAASYATASSSTFEAVAAALAAASNDTKGPAPPPASAIHPHWSSRAPAPMQLPGTGLMLRGASPLSRHASGVDEACDAGKVTHALVTPRAHACVAVTRSGQSAKGHVEVLSGETGKPSVRSAIPHLQKHLASIRLPVEDASAGALASPGPHALLSPMPMAGQKNRSLAHLKNQAWA